MAGAHAQLRRARLLELRITYDLAFDRIKDVVERLELRDEGYVLVRKIVYSTAEDFEQLRTSEYCVVPMPAFARVKYVLVDDEQVWASKASTTTAGQQKLEKSW